MSGQPKILLLDEDQDFLDLYREMLTQHLPSLPEVRVANSASRALSLLEAEEFTLLVTELNLSRMDGLQVLTLARRKHPQLRLVVLTAIKDEQFRARSYGLGVDQYWIKPETDQEMGLFMESIESLISREATEGFRGVQSKRLIDIIQLECLSQSSCMLKIISGVTEGRIFIESGEVIDAEMVGLTAEPAFQRMLSWKTGSFESLPPVPGRVRTIFTSYQGLLLNTAHAIDEAASHDPLVPESTTSDDGPAHSGDLASRLAEASQNEGVDFVLALGARKNTAASAWGLENPKPVAEFTRQTLQNFRSLGERLQAGELQQIMGTGPQRKVAVGSSGDSDLCIGFPSAVTNEQVNDSFKSILTKWAS